MALNDRLRGVVDWLLEGYPTGVPSKDYIPLLALLRRRLTEDEIREIAAEIAARTDPTATDIGVSITRLTEAMPSQVDVKRVEEHLSRFHHWPLEASGGGSRADSTTGAVCRVVTTRHTAPSCAQWSTTAFSAPAPVSERTSISAYFRALNSFEVMVPM